MDEVTLTAPAATSTSLMTILVLVLSSSVVAGALGHILTGLRAGATTRRDCYADAVKLLVARIEYPYRIRRRTSDDPDVLSALATAGHDLQERLVEAQAWITTESTVLSEVFSQCLISLDGPFKQACNDAWNAAPITAAAQMNLGSFGMGNRQHVVTTMERTLTYRFGSRRLIPAFLLRHLLKRRGLLT
ncbi:hypothetical protein [Streptomyces fulvoviolaceus]|uniref:hypothetical protein n=1 Tax=Streptomyces fulvoviolaceus TaxID=285535 RepID=UPI000693D09C|nr:hypothetical protein [Streptomyces fulvoviolaceus]